MSFNINRLVQPECGGPNPLVSASQQIATRPPIPRLHPLGNIGTKLNQTHFTSEFMKQQLTRNLQAFQPGPSGLHSAQVPFVANMMVHPQQQAFAVQQNQHQMPVNLTDVRNAGSTKLASDYLAEHEISDQVSKLRVASNASTSRSSSFHPYSALMTNQSIMNYTSLSGSRNHLSGPAERLVSMAAAADQLETKYRNDMISQTASAAAPAARHQDNREANDIAFWQSLAQKYIGPSTATGSFQAASDATSSAGASKLADPHTIAEGSSVDSDFNSANYEQLMRRQYLENAPSELEYVFDERNPFENYAEPFTEGLIALAREDIPSAALLFEAAVRKDPENAIAWRYLGTTQAQNEKDNSAIRALKNCLSLNNQDQVARLAIAVSLANETRHLESCKYLLEWLSNHEKYKTVGASVDTMNQINMRDVNGGNDFLGAERASNDALAYARDKFLEAARMSPNNPDPEVQSSLGVIFNISRDYTKAADCFKAALSVKMDDAILWNRLGATLANGYKPFDAVVAYRRALDISPGFLRSRYNLAISLIHMQQYVEASKQLIQILSMQAQGKGMKNGLIRTRSITSASIWNTLRTCVTLMNRPDLYPLIDGRDLARATDTIMKLNSDKVKEQQQQQQQHQQSNQDSPVDQ